MLSINSVKFGMSILAKDIFNKTVGQIPVLKYFKDSLWAVITSSYGNSLLGEDHACKFMVLRVNI